ncbi:MGMT family protein [Ignavibacteria bacterium]|nr:MGMT family protein [Bacteroidota bacterium]MCZ2131865.1 MGMT family protein [Bacteroidota bacterium]
MTDDIFRPKSGKITDFDIRVYAIAMQIPSGKVTTYGHIAAALGSRSASRMVGYALNSVKGRDEIPCHRVVNRNGELTGKMHFATPTAMRQALEAEGVEFIGEAVNMKKHLWLPAVSATDDALF